MAYISTLEIRQIRKELKKEFPEYKFSVRNQHHSSVAVSVLKGPAQFHTDMQGESSMHVNEYHIERNWGSENSAILNKMVEIIKTAPGRAEGGREWFDKSDYQSDYFHTAFYISLWIGKWDQPYLRG